MGRMSELQIEEQRENDEGVALEEAISMPSEAEVGSFEIAMVARDLENLATGLKEASTNDPALNQTAGLIQQVDTLIAILELGVTACNQISRTQSAESMIF